MDERLALAQLEALVAVPGALKIITGQIRPELRLSETDPRSPIRPELAAADPDILTRRRVYIWHDAARLERDAERGRVRVYSAEGDFTEGRPAAVLARLTEWQLDAVESARTAV